MTEEQMNERLERKKLKAFAEHLYGVAGAVWHGVSWNNASEGVRVLWEHYAYELMMSGVWYEGEAAWTSTTTT